MQTIRCSKHLTAVKPTPESLFENCITLEELIQETRGLFSRKTFYHWVSTQGMPHKKVRGRLLFPRADVFDWLERSDK